MRIKLILAMLTVSVGMYAQKNVSPDATTQDVTSDLITITLPAKNGVGEQYLNMVLVKNGRFLMGATAEQPVADDDEKPSHIVLLTNDYYIGETEITQEVWENVMGSNPATIKGENLPVESISWEDAHRFCERLTAITGYTFRLPTEAEWEYAARGGHKYVRPYIYAGSNNVDQVGWHLANSRANLNEVKQLQPNELGLYDMSGNVYELCEDTKEKYTSSQQKNPLVVKGNAQNKVRRGGSCRCQPDELRVSYRRRVGYDKNTGTHPGDDDTGLRVVMEVPAN